LTIMTAPHDSIPLPADGALADRLTAALTSARGTGEAADGLVHASVDGTGDLLDLVIEPKAMRLPSEDLAAAIKTAVAEARAAARTEVAENQPPAPDLSGLRGLVETLGNDAQRRMDEFARVADQLSARLDGRAR
jgi:DNA-binding protein YbaB